MTMGLWERFNGKKTIIGAVLIFASMAINQAVEIYSHQYDLVIVSDWMLASSDYLRWLGYFVTGGGVLHKMTKDGKKMETDTQRDNDFATLTVLLWVLVAAIVLAAYFGAPAHAGELGVRVDPVENATSYGIYCKTGETEVGATTENQEHVFTDLEDGCTIYDCWYTAINALGESEASPLSKSSVRPFLLGSPQFNGSQWILNGGNLAPQMVVQAALATAPDEFIDVAHTHDPDTPCERVLIAATGPEGPSAVKLRIWNVAYEGDTEARIGEITIDLPHVLPPPVEPVEPF